MLQKVGDNSVWDLPKLQIKRIPTGKNCFTGNGQISRRLFERGNMFTKNDFLGPGDKHVIDAPTSKKIGVKNPVVFDRRS